MEPWEDIERFRDIVVEMDLPHREMAYFGLPCPYCGKSDRIHRLERPVELDSPPVDYVRLWETYGQGGEIVVCVFCRQLLHYRPEEGRARPLVET